MSSTQSTDVVVLGAGPAGYVCAIRLAQLGKKVVVVDRAEVGGVCLNSGCIPSKALIYAGSLYESIAHAVEIGIEVQGVRIHLDQLMKWKNSVVKKLTGGIAQLLKAHGCTFIPGHARFVSPHQMEVTLNNHVTLIEFKQGVIATGSRPAALPIAGLTVDHQSILDSTSALNLQQKPKSLLCIGGGYIGLELGTFYAKIGTQVTVVEASDGLLSGVDPDLTRVVAKRLERLGVTVLLKTKCGQAVNVADGVEVTLGDQKKVFEKVLVTVGRVPHTKGIGLEEIGLKLDPQGFVPVSPQRRVISSSNLSHLFAIGDVAGQPLLAHKGSKEGIVAAEAIAGKSTSYDVVAMPAVIFTDPEIATVGLTEAEAKNKGFSVQLGVFPYTANGKALSMNDSDGFVKVVGDSKTGKLLGVHIVGAEASHLISEAALALEMGAHVEDMALTVHPHPTLSETLMEAAEATLGHAIHIFQKKRD